ncbi:MAG: tyrosine-type recombinase/integrase [Dermatophilus congolensis]|nr:tyrosine-type recombinase/integrase [Dermatophilus congolensis]
MIATHDLRKILRPLATACSEPEEGRFYVRRENFFDATTFVALVVMLATGARVTETCSLRVADVDLAEGFLLLQGKGRRQRRVPLTDERSVQLLSSYLACRVLAAHAHDRLLCNDRGLPLAPGSLRIRLHRTVKAAGVKRRVTPHMLRHTAATRLLDSGTDIRYIQRLLGHAHLATTEIYTHVSSRSLRDALAAADALREVWEDDN